MPKSLILVFLLIASCNKEVTIVNTPQSNEIIGAWHANAIGDEPGPHIIRAEYGTNGDYFYSETVINAKDDVVNSGTYTINGNKLRRVLGDVAEEVTFKIVGDTLYETKGDKKHVFKRAKKLRASHD